MVEIEGSRFKTTATADTGVDDDSVKDVLPVRIFSRAFRRALMAGSIVGLVAAPEFASAEQAVPVRVAYQVARGCPAESRFLARLRLHTSKVEVSHSDSALLLDVGVRATHRGFAGRLKVVKPNGKMGLRRFTDKDCSEVVSALALSAALSIDPEATLAVSETPSNTLSNTPSNTRGGEVSSGDAGGGPASALPATDTATDRESNEREAATGKGEGTGVESAFAGASGGSGRELQLSIGGFAHASVVFAPKALLGAGLSIGLSRDARRIFLPLDLSLHLAYLTSRFTRGTDPLLLDQYVATLEYCPLRLGQSSHFVLCGGLQAGALHGQGVNLQVTQRATRSYFAVQGGAGVRLPVGHGWNLVFASRIVVPLARRAFAINPGSIVVTNSRRVGGTASLGAVLGF